MTVIRPNSISGITSLTAHRGSIDFYAHDGSAARFDNINSNVTSGVSTFASLNITGDLDVGGALTYEDVTNVDSIGVVTARSGINATGDITFGANSKAKLFENGTQSGVQVTNSGSSAHLMTHDGNEDIHVDPSGYIKFEVAGSERLRISSDGNIGVNKTTPKEWYSTYKTLQIYDAAYIAGSSDDSFIAIGANNYLDTGGTYDYTNTDYASQLYQVDGQLVFRNAPSGTADTAITWAERFKVTSDGKFGIGNDNPDELLEVGDGTVSGALKVSGQSSSVTSDGFTVDWESSSNSTRFFSEPSSGGSSAIRFFTTSSGTRAEKLRITNDGKFGFNTTNPGAFDSGANHLVLLGNTSGTGNAGITIASGTDSYGNIYFADGTSGADAYRGHIAYNHNGNTMRFATNGSEKMRIDSSGNVSVNHGSPNTRLYVRESGVTISSTGNAILNSTQKGIRLVNSNNDDTSLGLWFTTGDSHHSGITGQRNDSSNTWGTDLRFYTHENATNDVTYTRERHRINPNGLLINRKGNNAVNTGGTILGRYKYTQINQGSGYAHLILGADGRKLQDYITTNCYCIITVCVTGTGTNNMFCQYYYHATSSGTSSNLTHMYGNSGSSSNRPYIELVNTHDPAWKMTHNGGYTLDIEVAIYGGENKKTFTNEFGDFTTNP